MVKPRTSGLWALVIGGLLSANSAFAQTDCTIPLRPDRSIDPAAMAAAINACMDAPSVWVELTDRGTYDLLYSGDADDPNRRITGIAHAAWSAEIPLQIGTVFGFRATTFAVPATADAKIQILTHFPDGPDGPRPPDVTEKPLTPGATEAALFFIGSEAFMIPGEWRIEIRYKDQILAAQRFELAASASE